MLLLQNTVVRFDEILSIEEKNSKKEHENRRKYHITISLDSEYCKIASIKKLSVLGKVSGGFKVTLLNKTGIYIFF